MFDIKRDLVPWLKLVLVLVVYAVVTGTIIASQGQRITSLEEQVRRDREDRAASIQREHAERKEVRDKLEALLQSVAELRAEERLVHRLSRSPSF